MPYVRKAIPVVLAFVLPWGLPCPWAQAHEVHKQEENTIVVRTGSAHWTYTREQLLAMATDAISNMKGTRKKPAIPLQALLFKDTKLSPNQVGMIFLIGDKVTILRGNDLNYLNKLILATGPEKGGKPHPWSLTTEDEETHKALTPHMGARRKQGVYRIDIVRKADGARQ